MLADDRDTVEFFGCPFDRVDMAQALARVESFLETEDGRIRHSVGVNVDQLLKMKREPDFARIVTNCDLITADGQAVVWWSRLLRDPLPERVPSVDLMHELLRRSAEVGHKIYLLGAKPEIVQRARDRFERDNPGVHIVGIHDGYFKPEDEPAIVEDINAKGADLLFIAITSPKKEEFIGRNHEALRIKFALGVGGAFDIAAGLTTRAPKWMQRRGLEWVWRVGLEPRRLGKRLVDDLTFVRYLPRDWLNHRRARQ